MKIEDSANCGVPEITPVEVSRARPVGSEPEAMDQVYGAVPPVAERVALYEVPMAPEGSATLDTTAKEELTALYDVPSM